jgi:hypothetical protein
MKAHTLGAAVLIVLRFLALADNAQKNDGDATLTKLLSNAANFAAITKNVKTHDDFLHTGLPATSKTSRRELRSARCRNAIRNRCGRRCNNLCRNQCYIRNMAFFNDIPGCVNANGVMFGARAGNADFDGDGKLNYLDSDDDNDGARDSEDEDVSCFHVR